MTRDDFRIGLEFHTASGKWRCTDLGTRVIVAIKLDKDDPSWYIGPLYAVTESVFDEHDLSGCSLDLEGFSGLTWHNRFCDPEDNMQWPEVRNAYPDQWLVIEALEAHTTPDRQRILDRLAVVDRCSDGAAAFQAYRRLHQQYPQREFYSLHTSREKLDIRESRWLGIRPRN